MSKIAWNCNERVSLRRAGREFQFFCKNYGFGDIPCSWSENLILAEYAYWCAFLVSFNSKLKYERCGFCLLKLEPNRKILLLRWKSQLGLFNALSRLGSPIKWPLPARILLLSYHLNIHSCIVSSATFFQYLPSDYLSLFQLLRSKTSERWSNSCYGWWGKESYQPCLNGLKRVWRKLCDGVFFTSYIFPDSLEKAILYPIMTRSGPLQITRGFQFAPRDGERFDHPHLLRTLRVLNMAMLNGLRIFGIISSAIPRSQQTYTELVKLSCHIRSLQLRQA